MADFRGDSREVWTSAKTVEHINAGSLQRIADATELMARRHLDLIRERDEYERRYKAACRSDGRDPRSPEIPWSSMVRNCRARRKNGTAIMSRRSRQRRDKRQPWPQEDES